MEFQESGLLDEQVIRNAFDYSQANLKSLDGEILQSFTQQIDAIYTRNLSALNMAHDAQKVTDADYDREKAMLDKIHENQLKMGPSVVAQELARAFKRRHLDAALEVQKNSENASPELIAAVLLIRNVRSPLDHQRIAAKFGGAVGGIIAEVLHIDSYPAARNANLSGAGEDTKRAYLALTVNNLEQIVFQAQQPGGRGIMLQPGFEETMFSIGKLLRGLDKKLDQRFVDTFSRVTQITASPFKLEVGEDGGIDLVKSAGRPTTIKPPSTGTGPTPTGPKGDDIF